MTVVAALAAAYVAPPALAVLGPTRTTRLLGLAGYAAGVTGRALVARRTRQRLLPDVLAHPVSVAAFGGLVARSWYARHAGTLTWRGRPLPAG